MSVSEKIARSLIIFVFGLTLFVVFILIFYMTAYSNRWGIVGIILLCGTLMGFATYTIVKWLPHSRRARAILLCIVMVLVSFPILSMFVSGKITYARFGFTVYGVIPIPVLDITIGKNGILWFRDKNHRVTLKEVQAQLDSGVDVVVIGVGWHNKVQVDSKVFQLGGDIHVLPSPEAFILFNRLKSKGKKVVLIAHSTC